MLERNWLQYGGVIVFALIFLAFIANNEPNNLELSEVRNEESCPYKTYHVGSNSDGGFEFRIERDTKACEHHQATQHEENGSGEPKTVAQSDLLAQERMAYWTGWIGVFTALGLSILYITFHATRQAVSETRRVGEAQTRGYLVLKPKWVCFDGEDTVWFTCELSAIGNTPITNVTISRQYFFFGRNGREVLGAVGPRPTSSYKGHTLIPGQIPVLDGEGLYCPNLIQRLSGNFGQKMHILTVNVEIYVAWLDVFRREHEVRYEIESLFMAPEPHSDIAPRITRIYPEKTYEKPRHVKWEARQARRERRKRERAGLIPKNSFGKKVVRQFYRFRGWVEDIRDDFFG